MNSGIKEPSSVEINKQVNKILESKDFQSSQKLSDFLKFIVNETINGNSDQLKGYTIATKVLKRGGDFDQSKDPIVRILAGRLRRALEYYYHTNGKSDSVHINIPVGSYIPEFEFFKNGSKKDETTGYISDITELNNHQKILIAILPFKDLSSGKNQAQILTGLAQDIIVELSRFRLFEISALSRNGKVHDESVYELYQKHGARFLLEGNFKKEKNVLKIFTELVDLKLNEVIWVEKYDLKIRGNNIFSIEEDLANKIVPVICSEYGIISKRVENELKPKKYHYLHDYEFIQGFYSVQLSFEKRNIKNLFAAAESIIKLKPNDGLLHAVTAGLSVFSYAFNLNVIKNPMEYASDHIAKAFNLESDNQMVRGLRAALFFLIDNEKLFGEEAETALSLNPFSPYYLGIYGFLLIHGGKYEEGYRHLKSGIELSYNYPSWWNIAMAAFYFRNKEYENAYNESLKINLPDTHWSYVYTIASLGKIKRKEESKKEIAGLKKLNPGFFKKKTELLSRMIKDKKLLDDLLDGFNKAGYK